MSSDALVSILIPSYNHAPFIAQAIESALNQTHPHIEVIVVDDGSTDDTRAVLSAYEGHDRVRVFLNDENRGHNWTLNKAIDESRGEFVSFLASDDWYLPEKTALQLARFAACGPKVGLVYGRGGRYFTATGKTVLTEVPRHRGDVVAASVRQQFVYPITPLIRRSVFDKVRFNPERRIDGESIYLWIAIYYEFDFVEDLVAIMRDHPGNLGKKHAEVYEALIVVFEELFANPDLPPDVVRTMPRKFADLHRTKGMQFVFDSMNFPSGRTALLRALRIRPLLALQPKTLGALLIVCLPPPIARRAVRFAKAPWIRRAAPKPEPSGLAIDVSPS